MIDFTLLCVMLNKNGGTCLSKLMVPTAQLSGVKPL